ncbi:MAG: nuclear transport factor 2 family protein [Acetobacteraceae bacterium]|jgi:ketosteroid isomerase-like protein
MSDGASVEVLQAVVDAFNDHDLDRIMGFFADDCVLEMPRGPSAFGSRYVGKQNVRQGLAGRFAGLPDVHYGSPTHFVDGNTGITKWTVTGTTPAGVRIEANGCDFYTFYDGKIGKKDSYWKIIET